MKKNSNIYLLYGEEKYDLEKKLSSIKKQFDKLENGVNLFYITKDNIDELGNILSEVTFFGSHKLVVIKNKEEKIETGLKKIGAMLGDEVEIGCGSVLNPGTIIGSHTNIYPLSSVRGVIKANSIYKNQNEIVDKK